MTCRTEGAGRATLARRGAFRVDQCVCGTLHLTMGVLTIRLEPLACTELTSTLLEAVERLHERVVVEAVPRTTQ